MKKYRIFIGRGSAKHIILKDFHFQAFAGNMAELWQKVAWLRLEYAKRQGASIQLLPGIKGSLRAMHLTGRPYRIGYAPTISRAIPAGLYVQRLDLPAPETETRVYLDHKEVDGAFFAGFQWENFRQGDEVWLEDNDLIPLNVAYFHYSVTTTGVGSIPDEWLVFLVSRPGKHWGILS